MTAQLSQCLFIDQFILRGVYLHFECRFLTLRCSSTSYPYLTLQQRVKDSPNAL